MKSGFVRSALVLGVLVPVYASAHHSTAVFDRDKSVELRGVVVDFKLRSPHSSFVVDARVFVNGERASAGIERWEIESEALPVLKTIGVDAQTFKPGEAITITVNPHRDPSFKFGHAIDIFAASGVQYALGSSNRIFSPSLAPAAAGGNVSAAASVGAEKRGIERLAGRWQQPITLPLPGDVTVLPLNAAGVAARNAYDRKLSPANTCEQMSVPDIFMAPFYLFEVQIDDGKAVLHNEAYDVLRTVSLDGKSAPADPAGRFGILTGRVDADTLVVESRGYPVSRWGLGAEVQIFGAGADVPSSEQKTVTERYSVSADGKTLAYEYTVFDPAYMTQPYGGRVELTRVPDATQIYPYECDVESAAMWSRTAKDKALKVGGQ